MGENRQPRSIQGLLNFCLANTAREDAPGASASEQMPDETRAWLSAALADGGLSASIDPARQLAEALGAVVMEDRAISEREDALEKIEDIVVDIDGAKDFMKMSGFAVVRKLVDDPSAGDLRVGALDVMATVVQNNPTCQQAALDAQMLPWLLGLVDDGKEADGLRVKAMYALSCLIREFPQGQKSFLYHDGLSVLLRACQTPHERLQTKAAFLLSCLCRASDDDPSDPPASATASPATPAAAPGTFVPSREFRRVLPGQAIPPGLHVRVNMQTGLQEARLVDPSDAPVTRDSMAVAVIPGNETPVTAATGAASQSAASGDSAGTTRQEVADVDPMDNIPDALVQMGLVDQLAAMLGRDPAAICEEHLLGALVGLAVRPGGAAECRRPELGLRETLEGRMAAMEGREECVEALDHAATLYQLIAAAGANSTVDR